MNTNTQKNTVVASDLLNALQTALPAVSDASMVAELSCFKINKKGTIEACGGDIAIRAKIQGFEMDTRCVVPAKMLISVVKSLGDKTIELTVLKKTLRLRCGDTIKARLKLLPVGDFPKVNYKAEWLEINKDAAEDIKQGISKLLFSMSRDVTDGVLTGVIYNGEELLFASDRHRITQYVLDPDAVASLKQLGAFTISAPAASFLAHSKSLLTRIAVQENATVFRFDDRTVLRSVRVGGRAPDFASYFKPNNTPVVLPLAKIIEAIRRAEITQTNSEALDRMVKVTTKNNAVTLAAFGDFGATTENIVLDEEDDVGVALLSLNPTYILAAAAYTDTISFYPKDQIVMMSDADEKFKHVMKMRSVAVGTKEETETDEED